MCYFAEFGHVKVMKKCVTDRRTNGPMDKRTDGQSLLQGCVDASYCNLKPHPCVILLILAMWRSWIKICYGPMDRWTDGSTDRASYRDVLMYLTAILNRIHVLFWWFWPCKSHEKKCVTDRRTDGPSDKASYRDAWTHLKSRQRHCALV